MENEEKDCLSERDHHAGWTFWYVFTLVEAVVLVIVFYLFSAHYA